jgi:hypothetical protein
MNLPVLSTMNFSIPANVSRDDIAAIVACGIDAMFNAVDTAGIDTDVAFFHEEGREAGDGDNSGGGKNNTKSMNDSNNNTDNEGEEEGVLTLATICGEYGEDPVFFQHEQLLIAFDKELHGSLAAEDVPANNMLRKKLYRQLTLLINGRPLGAGVRKELPSCCVSAARDMHPSDTFMGFRSE